MLLCLLAIAWAGGPDDKKDDDDWGFRTSSDIVIDTDDDDPLMADFVEAKRRKPAPTTPSHLYPEGKRPFADDWPLHVVSVNEHFVVVELPVLVAEDRVAFVKAHPQGVIVVGEWTSGPHTLTVRQEIRPRDVFAAGPTFAFLKAAIPNRKTTDQVRVVVKTADLPNPLTDAPSGADAHDGGRPSLDTPPAAPPLKVRYAQTTVYSR